MTVKLDLKNKVINGAFDYWQRGTSFVSPTNTSYLADRWAYGKSGTFTHTVTRSTDVPTTAVGTYSVLMTVTTAQASLTGIDSAGIQQRIEGNVLRSFKNKKMALSFWVKSSKAGIYSVAMSNSANDRSFVVEYTVNAINTWEKKTVRLTHDSTGSWLYDTGIGMFLWFSLGSGATRMTTPNAWVNTLALASVNQVNAVDTLSATFQLADVTFIEDNEGQSRVPDFTYAGRNIIEELQLCQRYFEKSTSHDSALTVASGEVSNFVSNGNTRVSINFNVDKRISATVLTYSTLDGAIGNYWLRGAANATSSNQLTTIVGANQKTVMISLQAYTANHYAYLNWTADAEL
jgi:hypothetical protein